MQINFRPTGGSDNNRNYEHQTLFNLANQSHTNQSNTDKSNTGKSSGPRHRQLSSTMKYQAQENRHEQMEQMQSSNQNSKNSEQGLDEISRLINE